MKKLTAKEILEIIKKADISVDNFAYGDFGAPDDFVGSPELEERKRIKKEALSNLYKKYKERREDSEYRALNKAYNEIPSYYKEENEEWLKVSGIGEWEEIEQYGGEDCGSTWYSIKHFIDHDVYIKTTGYYQSHHGTEFYDGYGEEVKPQTKTITVYE